MTRERLRVLRVYHSAVVAPWRARDRRLRELDVDITTVVPRRWNEGGRDVALEAGDDTFVVPAQTLGRHPYSFVYGPVRLWRVLRSAVFDVIDLHEEPASLAVAEVLALAWLARHRAPVCLYSAQNITKRYPIPFRWFERVALRRAAALHTCNDEAGRILRAKGFNGIIENLGLGVDVERFAPDVAAADDASAAQRRGGDAEGADEGSRPLRVGYVGRFEAHKGVSVLLEALTEVPDATLELVGDGPEHDSLVMAIARLDLADRARIRGFAPGAELPGIYRRFDVVVVPSLETPSWIEQFGRVAVEAMASGVVVVASDSGSLPEVVGDAGVLVPPGDPTALAEALRELADDRDERRRLRRAGRERAKRWSWSAIAKRQRDLYEAMARIRATNADSSKRRAWARITAPSKDDGS